ncbi:uncharacterized protein A1O9_08899 [Exophiala aquamarina CBS 119918]|uniref:Major facilitator superfamily (MFS) profile domain-containing protein n=1 Tax=Exophiala aquamarina CBS 119918 TaxID=1182545 RepID=A0A072PIA8_9EURO|nr:uncharacterized protein A1O9_08899 [Exophiala aquamarina CBS 119918]KEF55245.1 hypothetical protein A1O9_08899 [Exophiala aquamarina CBS 119918]
MSKTAEKEVNVEPYLDDVQHKEEITAEQIGSDPHDPLGWRTARKLSILAIIGLWVFIGTFNMIIIGPALQIVPVEFNSSFSSSTYLIGGPLLAYGVASFLWVPLANRYGSRLVFVLTAIAAACMSVWGAKATTFGSLVAARTLASGFFASPETLAPQMIGDVFYIKDRAKGITWINIVQATGYTAGPLFGSFIVQNTSLGWRWTQWIVAMITFGVATLIFLFVPETQYTRSAGMEKRTRSWKDNFRFWVVSGGGKPKVHSLRAAFVVMFPYFLHPIVIMSTFFFSICLMVANYLMTTQSYTFLVFYQFSLGHSGLTFIGPLIGTWLAIIVCGILADWRFNTLTRRYGSKPKPESRLPVYVFTGPVGVAGTILFGVCTQNQCHWIAPVIGSSALLFSFTSSAAILFAYLLDVYEARLDTVMVVFNGVKNIATFGISYAVLPWNAGGLTVPFVVLGVLLFVAHLLIMVTYIKGEAIRHWTAERFVTGQETHHGDAF